MSKTTIRASEAKFKPGDRVKHVTDNWTSQITTIINANDKADVKTQGYRYETLNGWSVPEHGLELKESKSVTKS